MNEILEQMGCTYFEVQEHCIILAGKCKKSDLKKETVKKISEEETNEKTV
jgi:hypothetical protein